jgi:hypothetical protein
VLSVVGRVSGAGEMKMMTEQWDFTHCSHDELIRAIESFRTETDRLREELKERREDEEFLRNYLCELWWFEKDGENGKWTLRHAFPDGHTIRDVEGLTLHAAITAARGK